MTYRYVPQRLLMWAQLLTLLVTATLGASIAVTPPQRDAKLTEIEEFMGTDPWAYALIAFSLVGFVCEAWMIRQKSERFISVVTWCHIALCGLLGAYATAAMVGVMVRVPWNFGAPALGLLIAYWHFVFVKRRQRA